MITVRTGEYSGTVIQFTHHSPTRQTAMGGQDGPRGPQPYGEVLAELHSRVAGTDWTGMYSSRELRQLGDFFHLVADDVERAQKRLDEKL